MPTGNLETSNDLDHVLTQLGPAALRRFSQACGQKCLKLLGDGFGTKANEHAQWIRQLMQTSDPLIGASYLAQNLKLLAARRMYLIKDESSAFRRRLEVHRIATGCDEPFDRAAFDHATQCLQDLLAYTTQEITPEAVHQSMLTLVQQLLQEGEEGSRE